MQPDGPRPKPPGPQPPGGGPGRQRAWRPLAWWLLLMLTLPMVIGLSLGADDWLDLAGPGDEAGSWRPNPFGLGSVAYAVACVAIALGFARRCRQRRAVLALYALALGVLWAGSDLLQLASVLTAVAALALPVLAVTLVRQNRPLCQQLRAAGVPLWRPLASALWLWSPALVLIGLGLWLQSQLHQAGLRITYGTGLVDRHCTRPGPPPASATAPSPGAAGGSAPSGAPAAMRSGQDPSAVWPCPPGWRDGEIPPLTVLPLRRSLQADVQQQLADLRLAVVAQTGDLAGWADASAATRRFDAAAALVHQRLVPPAPPGNAAPTDPALPQLLQQRAQLLHAEHQAQQMLRHPLVVILDGPRWRTQLRQRQDERARLDRQIADRQRALQQRLAQASRADPIGDLQRALSARLRAETGIDQRLQQARQRYLAVLAAAEAPTPGLRRAVARGELLGLMHGIAPAWVSARQAVLQPQADLARQAGLWQPWCALDLADDGGGHHRLLRCPQSAQGGGAVQPLPLRDNIDRSIDAWAASAETETAAGLEAAGVQAFEAGRMGRGSARQLFGGVPASLGLALPRCGLDPFCTLSNWAKRRGEAMYRDFREDAESRFVREVDRRADLGVLSAHEQLDQARQSLADHLALARDQAHRSVSTLFSLSDTLATLMAIWLVLVTIKSYLYVLALEVFHESGGACLGFDAPAGQQGRFVADDGIVVPQDFATPVLSFEVGVNQRKGLMLWKPWVATLQRLLSGRWAMSRGSHTPQAQMQFPARQGATGVCWHLARGECVVLDFAQLLGFSENVNLHSEVSLRLSTILFGRYVFHVAQCNQAPGLLLLTVPGPSVLADAAVHEVPLGRIKAFSRHARFRVASQRNWRAVFKDGFNLRRVDGDPATRGLVLVGASTDGGLRFQGLLRFVRTFLWPL